MSNFSLKHETEWAIIRIKQAAENENAVVKRATSKVIKELKELGDLAANIPELVDAIPDRCEEYLKHPGKFKPYRCVKCGKTVNIGYKYPQDKGVICFDCNRVREGY